MTTNNTMSNNTTGIKFRNKFVNRVLTDENRDTITKTFETFIGFDPGTAIELLWHMTYSSDNSRDFKMLGLEEYDIFFTEDTLFRNELRSQYDQRHPGFLVVTVPDGDCKVAFDTLVNKAGSVVAYIVYKQMYVLRDYDKYSIDRVLHLLNSDLENYVCGGLRELGFEWEEAGYLRPYGKEVRELVKALYDHKEANSKPDEAYKPFGGLDELLKKAGVELAPNPEDAVHGEAATEDQTSTIPVADETATAKNAKMENKAVTEEHHQETLATMDITSANVLKFKDSFEGYLKAQAELSKIGFDPAEVLKKAEKISKLLEAYEAF